MRNPAAVLVKALQRLAPVRAGLSKRFLAIAGSVSLIATFFLPIDQPSFAATLGAGDCEQTLDSATGVSVSQIGNECVVTFTSGTTSWTVPQGVSTVRVLVVGGGGGGDRGICSVNYGSGAGGGAVVHQTGVSVTGSVSVVVGSGGSAAPANCNGPEGRTSGTAGQASSFGNLQALGGGVPVDQGAIGGASGNSNQGGTGTAGASTAFQSGGGGGAGGPGGQGNNRNGGLGVSSNISGSAKVYGAGGPGTESQGVTGVLYGSYSGANAPTVRSNLTAHWDPNSGGGGADWTPGADGVVVVRYALQKPADVTGLQVTSTRYVDADSDADQVSLSWTQAPAQTPAVTGYKVLYSANADMSSPSSTTVSGIGSTSTTVTGLDDGNTYYFQVFATNDQAVGSGIEISNASATVVDRAISRDDFALDFDASLTALNAGSVIPNTDGSAFSVEAWAKPDNSWSFVNGDDANNYKAIVVQGETQNNNSARFGLWLYAESATKFNIHVGGASGAVANFEIPDPRGKWSHFAVTTARDDQIKLFVDGQIYGEAPLNIAAIDTGFAVGSNADASRNRFLGQIDQVKIWGDVLAPPEVEASMHAWQADTNGDGTDDLDNLIAHYDFNDSTQASILRDTAGANDLTITNGETADFKSLVNRPTRAGYEVFDFTRSYLTATGGWTVPTGAEKFDVLVVAGGGAGGSRHGGGGGAGGLAHGTDFSLSGTIPIVVGMGGLGAVATSTCLPANSTSGQSSKLASIEVVGGGRGSSGCNGQAAEAGGSSGGASSRSGTVAKAAQASSVTGIEYLGSAGGNGITNPTNAWAGGGGGGAGGVGADATTTSLNNGGTGGKGYVSSILGSSYCFAGGGGGGVGSAGGDAGLAIDCDGPVSSTAGDGTKSNVAALSAESNSGSGGGGSGYSGDNNGASGSGGSGRIVVAYTTAMVTFSGPTNQTALSTQTATFTVSTAGTQGTPSFQWEVSFDSGASWSNVSGGSGGTTASYTTPALQVSDNGNQYRVVVTSTVNGTTDTTTTSAATLTVSDAAASSLFLHYDFSDIASFDSSVSTTAVTDLSTKGLDGTVLNDSAITLQNQTLVFNGSSYIDVATMPASISFENGFTAEFVADFGSTSTRESDEEIFRFQVANDDETVFLSRYSTGNSLIYRVYDYGNSNTYREVIFDNALLNRTGLNRYTLSHSSSGVELYINGARYTGRYNSGSAISAPFADYFPSAIERTDVRVGGGGFKGSIRELRLYNFGFSQAYLDANISSFAATYNTVTFDSNGGTDPNDLVTSGAIRLPSPGTRTGFTFGGWYTDETYATLAGQTGDSYTPGDTSLHAKWTGNNLTVTWNPNGGSAVANGTVATDAQLTAPAAPNRTGYTFAGWSATDGGTAVTFPYTHNQTASFNMYALWTINSYTLTLDNEGVTTTQSVQFNATPSDPGTTRSGFNLVGWSDESDQSAEYLADLSDYTMGSADDTLYAVWSSTLTITTPTSGLSGTVGTSFTALTIATSGGSGTNVFSVSTGTLPAGLSLNSSTGVISGTPTTAGSQSIQVTVTDAASSTATTSSFTISISAATLSTVQNLTVTATAGTLKSIQVTWTGNPNADSYTLKIYSADGNTLLDTVSLANNLTSYTITSAAGSFEAIADGTEYQVSLTAVGTGNYVTSAESAKVSVTTLGSYAITWDVNGGTLAGGEAASFIQSGNIVEPSDPTRSGFTFDGWSTSESANNGSVADKISSWPYSPVANAPLTLYAIWISDLEIVTPTTGLSATFDEAYTLAMTASGGDGTKAFSATGLPSGLSISASTGEISGTPTAAGSSSVTVTVTTSSSQTATATFTITVAQKTLATPATPTASAPDGELKKINVGWVADPNAASYTIKIYSNADVELEEITGLSGTSTVITTSEFAAIADGTAYKISVIAVGAGNYATSAESARRNVTTNETLTVTWNSQGGSSVSPTTFITGATVALPSAPTKSGKVLAGWSTIESGGSGLMVNRIDEWPYDPAGNVDFTLHAIWLDPCTPTVTTFVADGTADITSATFGAAGKTYRQLVFDSLTDCGWAAPAGVTDIDLLVVGGGGSGGFGQRGGGGGAGEVLRTSTGLTISSGEQFLVDVGAGALFGPNDRGNSGTKTRFGYFEALGGGAGGGGNNQAFIATDGGSGGGGARCTTSISGGASLATDRYADLVELGNAGGNSIGACTAAQPGGGGGGAGSAGNNSGVGISNSGAGGAPVKIFGKVVAGGGAAWNSGSLLGGALDGVRVGGSWAGGSKNGVNGSGSGASAQGTGGSGTVVIRFEVPLRTLTLDNEGSTTTQSVEVGLNPTDPSSSVTRTGYTLAGWSDDDDTVSEYDADLSDYTMGVADDTLYAVWTADDNTVTFKSNYTGGAADKTQTITTDAATALNQSFTRAGYTFDEWTTNADGTGTSYTLTETVTIQGDLTLYAQWVASVYTLTYNYNGATGGNAAATVTYTSGGLPITLAIPTRTGYTFDGWFLDSGFSGSALGQTLTLSADDDVYAKWSANTYVVIFNYNGATAGNTVEDDSYTTNDASTAITLPTPTRIGYNFEGWYEASDFSGTALSSPYTTSLNKTIHAKWEAIDYAFSYDANGGTGALPSASVDYNFQDNVAVLGRGTLSRTGFTFQGWTDNAGGTGTVYDSGDSISMPAAPLTLYAKWQANTYTISYNLNGGSGDLSGAPTSWTTGDNNITLPSGFTRTGFNFDGWQKLGTTTKLNNSYFPNYENVTLVARWVLKDIAITYAKGSASGASVTDLMLSGLSFPANLSKKFGETLSLSSALAGEEIQALGGGSVDHEFFGWSDGTSTYQPNDSYVLTETPPTFTAQWARIYQVNYAYNGGTPSGSDGQFDTQCLGGDNTCSSGQTIQLNSAPSRSGYDFTGWKDQSNNTYAAGGNMTVSANSFLLYAQWDAIEYQFTFNSLGGSQNNASQDLNIGQVLTFPNPGTKSGYTFGGWSSDGGITKFDRGATLVVGTSGAAFSAVWVPNVYQISYDWQGGSGTPVTSSSFLSYTVGTGNMALPPVGDRTRDGFEFAGWSESVGGSVLSNYQPTQDRVLYAVWNDGNFTLSYDGKGGNVAGGIGTVARTQSLTLPTPLRAGFVLTGWYDSATGGTKIGNAGDNYTPTRSKTLYARWVQRSLFGVDPATLENASSTLTATGPDGQPQIGGITSGPTSATVTVPAGALPAGTVVQAKYFRDTARQSALIPGDNQYFFSVLISWLNGSGDTATVPDTDPTKPVSVTITNTAIKAGARIFQVIGDQVTDLGVATQDGTVTVELYEDPEIVIAATKPEAPTNVVGTSADTQSQVSWSAPSNGGSEITGYTVTSSPGGFTCSTATTSCLVTGLTNGTTYTFSVTATNSVGTSSASAPSAAVVPGIVTYTATFDSNGGSAVASATFQAGGVLTAPTAPTRSGYTFVGWSTVLNDVNTRINFPYTASNQNMTFFALWNQNLSDPGPLISDAGTPALTPQPEAPRSRIGFIPTPPSTPVSETGPVGEVSGSSQQVKFTPDALRENLTATGLGWQIRVRMQNSSGKVSRISEQLDLVTPMVGRASVSASGLRPNTFVELWNPGDKSLIGSLNVGADGSLNGSISLPKTLLPGEHTLQVATLNSLGQLITLSIPLRVKGKVTVGAFKGYIAIYTLGIMGQKLSAKVAGKWIVQEPIVAFKKFGYSRLVRFTGAGYNIIVDTYINGQFFERTNTKTR